MVGMSAESCLARSFFPESVTPDRCLKRESSSPGSSTLVMISTSWSLPVGTASIINGLLLKLNPSSRDALTIMSRSKLRAFSPPHTSSESRIFRFSRSSFVRTQRSCLSFIFSIFILSFLFFVKPNCRIQWSEQLTVQSCTHYIESPIFVKSNTLYSL